MKDQPAVQDMPKAAVVGSVEWDHKGRVIRARFVNGQILQFRYDQQGCLYAFTYAGLAWSTTSGDRWTAVDEDNTYIIEGTVEVGIDGCLYIQKDGVRRGVKLNGVISDQLEDGTVVESARLSQELAPQDLLAVIKPKNSDTLNRLTPYRPSSEKASVDLKIESVDAAPVVRQPATPPASPAGAAPARTALAQGVRIRSMKESVARAEAAAAPPKDFLSRLKQLTATWKVRVSDALRGQNTAALAPQFDVLAAAAYAERRVDEARLLHERSLAIRRKTLGSQHPDVGISLHGLATIYHDWGRFNEAEQYYLEAIKLLDNGFRKAIFLHSIAAVDAAYLSEHLDRLIFSLHSLASMYHEHKRPQLCEQIYHAAAHLCAKVGEPYKTQVAAKLQSMAAMCVHLDMAKRPPDAQLRISRWERRARF